MTSDLMKSKPMTIARYYFTEHSQVKKYQLYGFYDTLMVAYAAVIYPHHLGIIPALNHEFSL